MVAAIFAEHAEGTPPGTIGCILSAARGASM
jgi:hypothetical protein